MNRIVGLMLLLLCLPVMAETVYVSYRWAPAEATALTESWAIVSTKTSTRTAPGMEELIRVLADDKGVDTVVVTYVRQLAEEVPAGEESRSVLRAQGTPI